MVNSNVCGKCKKPYDIESCIPKKLNCGHHFCASCLTYQYGNNILGNNKLTCFLCSGYITLPWAKLETCTDLLENSDDHRCSKQLKISLNYCKDTLDKASEITSKNISWINSKLGNTPINSNNYENIKEELHTKMKDLSKIVKPWNLYPNILPFEKNAKFNMIFSNNDEVYAAVQLGRETRFGVILCVHLDYFLCSLTKFAVPEDAKVYSYYEVKHASTTTLGFLSLPVGAKMALTFLLKCNGQVPENFTGSRGRCFKNKEFCHKMTTDQSGKTLWLELKNSETKDFLNNDFKVSDYIGNVLPDNMIINYLDKKYMFEIVEIYENLKFDYPEENFENEKYWNKVLECGIVLNATKKIVEQVDEKVTKSPLEKYYHVNDLGP